MTEKTTVNSASSENSRVDALTGIRAAAALLVTLHHIGKMPAFSFDFGKGAMGVAVFFSLSGYLITYRYFGRIGRDLTFASYWLRRVARIFPAYLFMLAVITIMGKSNVGPGFWDWASVLSLVHGYFYPNIWFGLGPVSWSLTVEESFYLFAPLIFIFCGPWNVSFRLIPHSLEKSAWGWLIPLLKFAVVFLCFRWLYFLIYHWGYRESFMAGKSHLETYSILGRFPEFALGIALALFHRSTAGQVLFGIQRRGLGWILFISGGFMAILCFADLPLLEPIYAQGFGNVYRLNFSLILVSLATTLLIASALMGNLAMKWILGNQVAVYLGKISYCLYLLNADALMNGVRLLLPEDFWAFPGGSLAFYLFLCLFAAAAFHLIENPIHRKVIHWSGSTPR